MTRSVGIRASTLCSMLRKPSSSVMISAGRASCSTWSSQSGGLWGSSATNGRPAARQASIASGNIGHAGSRTPISSPGFVSASSVSASPETASQSSPKVRAVFASLTAMRPRCRRAIRSKCSTIGWCRSWSRTGVKGRSTGPFQSNGRGSSASHTNVGKVSEALRRRVSPMACGAIDIETLCLRRRTSTACSRVPSRRGWPGS